MPERYRPQDKERPITSSASLTRSRPQTFRVTALSRPPDRPPWKSVNQAAGSQATAPRVFSPNSRSRIKSETVSGNAETGKSASRADNAAGSAGTDCQPPGSDRKAASRSGQLAPGRYPQPRPPGSSHCAQNRRRQPPVRHKASSCRTGSGKTSPTPPAPPGPRPAASPAATRIESAPDKAGPLAAASQLSRNGLRKPVGRPGLRPPPEQRPETGLAGCRMLIWQRESRPAPAGGRAPP